jgi:hypothetical protein
MNKIKRICETCKKEFIPIDKINYHCQECQPCKPVDKTMNKEIEEILNVFLEFDQLNKDNQEWVLSKINNLFTSKLKDIIEEVEERKCKIEKAKQDCLYNGFSLIASCLKSEIKYLTEFLTKLKELAE